MVITISKLVALGAALAGGICALPRASLSSSTSPSLSSGPASNATQVVPRDGPSTADFFVDDQWHQLQCLFGGVAQHEFLEADKSFRKWLRSGSPMIKENSAVIHAYGYTQVYTCSYAGAQPAKEEEYDKFLRMAQDKCHGEPGQGNNDRGAKLWFSTWGKEYGYASTGFDPCPEVRDRERPGITPPNYNELPL